MLNFFTLKSTIDTIQEEVLQPIYTLHAASGIAHATLMQQTGNIIERHVPFIEDVCRSRLIAVLFRVVKFLGGADNLTAEDFNRFTSYVRDGGIPAMLKMLSAEDMEQAFSAELRRLPEEIQVNAPLMLRKARDLHDDFIHAYFKKQYLDAEIPAQLLKNLEASEAFILRLAALADQNLASRVAC